MARQRFQINLQGPDSPKEVSARSLAEILTRLEDFLCAYLEGKGLELSSGEPALSLVGVEAGSAGLAVSTGQMVFTTGLVFSIPGSVVPALSAASNAILHGDYEGIPARAHRELFQLSERLRARGWSASFAEDPALRIAPAKITPERGVLPPSELARFQQAAMLLARCLGVGGSPKPRAELRLSQSGALLSVEVSEPIAKALGRRLYEEVVLEGIATWDTETWKVLDFKVNEVMGPTGTEPERNPEGPPAGARLTVEDRPPEESCEIIPGQSVGPFRLGMSREDIEGLNILPMETFKDGLGAEFTAIGVKVYYDESGRCAKIEARTFGEGTAKFILAGQPVNDISEKDAEAIFRSISPEIRPVPGGFDLPAAGLRTFKWEDSDDFLYSILVKPPEGRTAPSAPAAPPPGPKPPARMVLELEGRQVVFVRAEENLYAAELDGRRRPIRTRQQLSDVSEGGVLHQYKPTRSEGETANLAPLLRCLALGAAHTPLARGLRLSAIDRWGHFRQNTFLTVSVTISEDGVVEIDEDIQVQDDSYY